MSDLRDNFLAKLVESDEFVPFPSNLLLTADIVLDLRHQARAIKRGLPAHYRVGLADPYVLGRIARNRHNRALRSLVAELDECNVDTDEFNVLEFKKPKRRLSSKESSVHMLTLDYDGEQSEYRYG